MSKHVVLGLGARVALAAVLAGCDRAAERPAEAPPPPRAASAQPPKPAAPPGQVARGDVEQVLAQGPPWLLRRVQVEEVIRGGAFIGWKILALPDRWTAVDLKAGDVVTKVNGTTLERPDDLFAAWRGLATAKEIRIAVEREGTPREVVIPIAGEPSKELVQAYAGDAPPPPPRPAPGRKRTVKVIEEDDGSPPEGDAQ